jgi:hypothetical protein
MSSSHFPMPSTRPSNHFSTGRNNGLSSRAHAHYPPRHRHSNVRHCNSIWNSGYGTRKCCTHHPRAITIERQTPSSKTSKVETQLHKHVPASPTFTHRFSVAAEAYPVLLISSLCLLAAIHAVARGKLLRDKSGGDPKSRLCMISRRFLSFEAGDDPQD